jgi:hypothetical protein
MLIIRGMVDGTLLVRGMTLPVPLCLYKEVVTFLSPLQRDVYLTSKVSDGTRNCLY